MDEWKTLYNSNPRTIFQSYEYNVISWKYKVLHGKLYIIAYVDNDNHVKAILPTYIDSRGTLRFINDSGTDICDLIYDSNSNLFDVAKEMNSYIIANKKIKNLSLENLTHESPLLSYFKIFFSKSIIFSNNEVSFLDCQQSEDTISEFKHLSSDRRKKLKKVVKLASDFKFKIFNHGNGDEIPLLPLKELAKSMVEHGIRKKAYFNQPFWDFVTECFDNNLIEVALLYDNGGTPISAGFVFINNRVSIRWVILYCEPKYNLWNNILYMETKGKTCSYENNFGRGGYDYKMNNFKPHISLLYKIIIPNQNSGYLRCVRIITLYMAKRFLKEYKNSFLSKFKSYFYKNK